MDSNGMHRQVQGVSQLLDSFWELASKTAFIATAILVLGRVGLDVFIRSVDHLVGFKQRQPGNSLSLLLRSAFTQKIKAGYGLRSTGLPLLDPSFPRSLVPSFNTHAMAPRDIKVLVGGQDKYMG